MGGDGPDFILDAVEVAGLHAVAVAYGGGVVPAVISGPADGHAVFVLPGQAAAPVVEEASFQIILFFPGQEGELAYT